MSACGSAATEAISRFAQMQNFLIKRALIKMHTKQMPHPFPDAASDRTCV
jgi:hypothetical protein